MTGIKCYESNEAVVPKLAGNGVPFLAFGVALSLLASALLPTKSRFPLCCNHPSHVLSNIQSLKSSFVFHGSD